ncbi:hypothetical protein ACFLSW_01810 [Candidatus Bipolaricaulota bacterium]
MSFVEMTFDMELPIDAVHAVGIMKQRVLYQGLPLLMACVVGCLVGMLAVRVL